MREHLLSILLASPLLGALVLLFVPCKVFRTIRAVALASAIPPVLIAAALPSLYDGAHGGFQFVEVWRVIPSIGVDLRLAVDGIGVALVVLTAAIYVTAIFTSWRLREREKEFFLFLALLVCGVFGVFVSLDLFMFFLFYELAVLPIYVLIGIWGSTMVIPGQGPFRRAFEATRVGTEEYGAMKLTLYLLAGSAFILVGLFILYVEGGKFLPAPTFDFVALREIPLSLDLQTTLFLLFYVGFGVLAGIWPIHTWSPDGHAAAPCRSDPQHKQI